MKTTGRSTQPPTDPRVKARKGHGAKSAAVRERAILALLSERTIQRAAKKCHVSEWTLRQWLAKDDEFQASYKAARAAAFETGMHRIQVLLARSVDTLEDLLGRKVAPTVRLGAARTVAEIGIHQHDADTILRKLEEIEAQQRRQ